MVQDPAADLHDLFRHRRPDFLVISPPKTGSTWLAANLRCHPSLFVPELKEVKYFSSLYKWLDFAWYCEHFAPAGDRRAGEVSPSYASLPLSRIRAVRRLLPDVKLVYLMRDPVSRAWSHAKHNRRYREANFASSGTEPATPERWRENFVHDWPLVSGDYLGQLRRWSSVFPGEQLYVGFYEDIVTRPEPLLRDLFRFLGVDPSGDLTGHPIGERILAGESGDLPADLAPGLRGVLHERTQELTVFLRDRFGLTVPREWEATLGTEMPSTPPLEWPRAFQSQDDDYLAGVVGQEESFASSFRLLVPNYRGYLIAFHRGTLYGVPHASGSISAALLDELAPRSPADGSHVVAATLAELKEEITTRLLESAFGRIRAAEEELHANRQTVARLSEGLAVALRPSVARRFLRAVARRAGLRRGNRAS